MNVLDPADRRLLLAELLRRKAQRAQPLPLSAAQHRLWLLDRLAPGASTYNVPSAFRLRGALDRDALARALATIVQRHDVLRATIGIEAGEPVFRVNEAFAPALPVVDIVSAAELDELLADQSGYPFDLARDVPIRALLARIGAGEHVLLINLHHIAVDGWSLAIFKRELTRLYEAYRAGSDPQLDLPACTYADFVAWHQARLSDGAAARQQQYWAAQLCELPEPLAFAPRGAGEPPAGGGFLTRTLDSALAVAVQRFCAGHRTTPFALFLAAFSAVLHRYTGSRDFFIGAAVANRTRAEFEDLIGFFVNTLPLRARIPDDPTFADWLARTHAQAIDALDNQDIPFQTLVEAAQPERHAAGQALLNVMFVLQNTPDEPLSLAGLEVATVALPRTTAKFDLTLEVIVTGDRVQLGFEYRSSRFDGAAIEALLDALQTLLADALRDPDRALSQLALLPPPAVAQQLQAWNDTERPLSGKRIERLFEEQVRRDPRAIAVVDGATQLTYGALDARANRLARRLRAAGHGPGARVGTCFVPNAHAVVATLAVLKIGGIYVPLDPQYPADRLAHMLADAGVSVVLSDRQSSAALAGLTGIDVVRVDTGRARLARRSPANDAGASAAAAAQAAYIMYTSGSTGTPKGVLVAHAGIERLVTQTNYVRITSDDRLAFAATLAFDASTFELWGALLNGARLVVVPKRTLLAPHDLRAAIARGGISVMFLTTALLREVVRTAPATFAGLRTLIVGGDRFDVETATRLQAAAPPRELINGYGPTEATTFATTWALAGRPAGAVIPIGRPIANTTVYVLDANRRLLPAGAAGELYIGGPGVALGYLNDPARTAEKFVPDPFAATAGARLYATGDRVRYRADGTLEFLGRADGQLKRRGFRIEPAEIEATLRACAPISDAAVVADIDDSGECRLRAFVVAAGPAGLEFDAICDELRRRLTTVMLPDTIVALKQLPLQPNGKVDRAALLAVPATPRGPVREAQTETQSRLVALWERLLAVGPIGIADDFFALGGHSLLAVRLLGEIESVFGVRLPAELLFERPTIEQLAAALHAGPNAGPGEAVRTLNAAGTAQPLFFLHGSVDGDGFYCRTLAEYAGARRPLHVLRPHGQAGRPLPGTIEAMAADYVELVRRLQPQGPYLLGGFCAGGLVAYEMARQLVAAGEQVSQVILLDVPVASRRLRLSAALADRIGTTLRVPARVRAGWRNAIGRLPHHRRRLLSSESKLRFVSERLARGLRRLVGVAGPPATGGAAASLLPAWTQRAEQYVPRRYAGPVTLFYTHADAAGAAPAAGWTSIAPQVVLRPIRGTHLSCIGEFINDTARAVAQALEQLP